MRIIKPYGRSITQKGQDKTHRVLHETKTNEKPDLHRYSHESADLVIAQWISALDKIIRKPKAKKKATQAQRDVRDAISKEMWRLLEQRFKANGLPSENFRKKWWAKVHPYETEDRENNNRDTRTMKGRWYQRFCGEQEPDQIDPKKIASDIEDHLYVERKRIVETHERPSSDDRGKGRGLIALRAKSITQNVLSLTKPEAFQWRDKYFATSDVAKQIYDEVKTEADEKGGKISAAAAFTIAARNLHNHYAAIFVKEDGLVMTIGEAKAHPLFAMHQAIKQTYRRLFKQSKVKNENLVKRTPRTKNALEGLVHHKRDNQRINHDIRLGKILHYELMRRANNKPEDAHKKHWAACVHEIEQSEFWLTEGQITIKQNEAFQRVWRTSIAFMARGLRSLVDPHYELKLNNNDILSADTATINDYANFRTQISLVYGSSASCLLKKDDDDDACAALFASMKGSLSNLRNRSFHPTNFVTFCKEIEKIGRGCDEKLSNFWQEHHRQCYERLIDVLEGVRSPYFFNAEENKQIITAIRSDGANMMPLPRFNRVLARADNASLKNLGVTLPSPAKSRLLKKSPALQCKYTLLKLLYERPFRGYVSKLSKDKLEKCVKASIARTTEAARKMNKKGDNDVIIARADGIISNESFETMADFFDALTAATATEMRVQKHYEPDPKKQQKQTKYIDDLKADVLAMAFNDWLKKQSYKWLVDLNEKIQMPSDRKCDLRSFRVMSEEAEGDPWQKTLFVLLFLMPATPANRLVNQFRKWMILRGKHAPQESQEAKDLTQKLIAVFDLYMDTHNSFQDGQEAIAENDEILKAFFENQDDFTRVFPETDNPHDSGHLPLRGLREMLRFGDASLLAPIFEKVRITNATVQKWQAQKDGITEQQEQRAELHEIVSKNRRPADQDKSAYKKLQQQVSQFRDLAHHCSFTNHVELHGLMIEVLGRLVDFSGLFERDLYFEMLAHFYHENVPLNCGEIFKHRGKLANGQIYEFYDKNEEKIDKRPARLCDQHLMDYRNNIAHFNMLSLNIALNLTNEINHLRHLMAYDRKLKNAVSKSVIDLFYREGMTLHWQMNEDHDLHNAKISARKITHLKQNDITEALKGDKYLEMVAILMGGEVHKTADDRPKKNHRPKYPNYSKHRRDEWKK